MEHCGKVVYVLGAGASRHAGAPLMSNFMHEIENVYRTTLNESEKKIFQTFLDWYAQFKTTQAGALIEINNLEEIHSFLLLRKEIGDEEANRLYETLLKIMVTTIDRKTEYENSHDGPTDATMRYFIELIIDCSNKRVTKFPGGEGRDSIITFNYDLLIDHAANVLGLHLALDPNNSPNPRMPTFPRFSCQGQLVFSGR